MQENHKMMQSLSQLDALCASGYAIALHISYTTPRFLFQTYSKDWMKKYSEQGLVLKDPTVLWGFTNIGVAKWSDLAPLDASGVLAQAKEFGLKYGFTYSVDLGSSKTIASFSRSDREFTDQEISDISDVVLELHRYTADIEELPTEDLAHLKKISVEYTHG